jgi:hypothetical protein
MTHPDMTMVTAPADAGQPWLSSWAKRRFRPVSDLPA